MFSQQETHANAYKVYSASRLSPACDERKQNECFVFQVKPTAEVDGSNGTLRFHYNILGKMTTTGIDIIK